MNSSPLASHSNYFIIWPGVDTLFSGLTLITSYLASVLCSSYFKLLALVFQISYMSKPHAICSQNYISQE